MVLLDSDRITRVPPYLGAALLFPTFAYGTITPYGHASQRVLLAFQIRYEQSHNPYQKNPIGLGKSTDFARRYSRYLN